MSDHVVRNVTRKMITLAGNGERFVVDFVTTKFVEGRPELTEHLIKARSVDGKKKVDWVEFTGSDPAFGFADYLKEKF